VALLPTRNVPHQAPHHTDTTRARSHRTTDTTRPSPRWESHIPGTAGTAGGADGTEAAATGAGAGLLACSFSCCFCGGQRNEHRQHIDALQHEDHPRNTCGVALTKHMLTHLEFSNLCCLGDAKTLQCPGTRGDTDEHETPLHTTQPPQARESKRRRCDEAYFSSAWCRSTTTARISCVIWATLSLFMATRDLLRAWDSSSEEDPHDTWAPSRYPHAPCPSPAPHRLQPFAWIDQ